MTKGIRAFTNATFVATLPQLNELGPVAFRRTVMEASITNFGISIASAATHYNHALKLAKEATPTAVAGLGRPDDKKGGRKKKTAVVIVDAATEALLLGAMPAEAALM